MTMMPLSRLLLLGLVALVALSACRTTAQKPTTEAIPQVLSNNAACTIAANDDDTHILGCDGGTRITFADSAAGLASASCTIDESNGSAPQIRCRDDQLLSRLAARDCQLHGDYHIENSRDLVLFSASGCTEITGSLFITNTALTDLQGLENLQSIGGDFGIGGNQNLTSLKGLENLHFVSGDFGLGGNHEFINLQGLENLHTIHGNFVLAENNGLNDLQGLQTLQSIGGDLLILDNNALTSLEGLESLHFINGDFTVVRSSSLLALNGLEKLQSIGKDLVITENPSLVGLQGLENLQSIGGALQLINNDSLESLKGIESLQTIGGFLGIASNLALPTCSIQIFVDEIGKENMGGSISFSGNNDEGICHDTQEHLN